jgi:hypothetical protein
MLGKPILAMIFRVIHLWNSANFGWTVPLCLKPEDETK